MESDFSRFSKLRDIREVEISQELCPAEKKKSTSGRPAAVPSTKSVMLKLSVLTAA